MAMLDQEPHMMDATGVPEFFSSCVGVIEDAGGGNIRIIRCIERRGVLVPVFSSVCPALTMMQTVPIVQEICLKIVYAGGARH